LPDASSTFSTFSNRKTCGREINDAAQLPLHFEKVENVELASGNVIVALRMTSPMCQALPYFQMEVERVLAGIPGIDGVKCTFDHGANWQPDNMTVDAQRKLAERREFVRSRAVKPAKTG